MYWNSYKQIIFSAELSCICSNFQYSIRLDVMMRQGVTHAPQRNKPKFGSGKCPSLVDLCVQTAIDNVRYLGDVGETDIHLLERILPHCTVDQLMYIENETKERDLSQVTNKLWKKYYEVKFGAEHTNEVIGRLKGIKQKFTWKQLYEAKLEAQDEAQKQSLERLTQLYKKDNERRQSKQIQMCSKAPPSAKRRYFGGYGGGSSVANVKSNIMKKAKTEYLKSQEIKNLKAIKRNSIQRSPVISCPSKPSNSAYRPNMSQCNPGSSQMKNSPSSQGSLQFKASASASASRYVKTDKEEGAKRNPVPSKGKATSLQFKNSMVASRAPEIDEDGDIKRKLSEFW